MKQLSTFVDLLEIIREIEHDEINVELKSTYTAMVDCLYAQKIFVHNNARSKPASDKCQSNPKKKATPPPNKKQKKPSEDCRTNRGQTNHQNSSRYQGQTFNHNRRNRPAQNKQDLSKLLIKLTNATTKLTELCVNWTYFPFALQNSLSVIGFPFHPRLELSPHFSICNSLPIHSSIIYHLSPSHVCLLSGTTCAWVTNQQHTHNWANSK